MRSQSVTASQSKRNTSATPYAQLNNIYDAMENLLDEKAAQRKWDERDRVGFKNEK